jgi:hypothetical protein
MSDRQAAAIATAISETGAVTPEMAIEAIIDELDRWLTPAAK